MEKLVKIEEPASKKIACPATWEDFLELGFRPLYLGGALWAILAVSLWVYTPHLLQGVLSSVFWHAHEMLWGFVAPIAVGFLLTATNNWTGINPLQGTALAGLTMAWLIARIGFLIPGSIAFFIASAAEILFFLWASTAIARCLIQTKSKHNYGLPVLLLGIAAADTAFLYAIWRNPEYTSLMRYFFAGLLCMLVIALLVARRVIPFFASRAVGGLTLNRHTRSGHWQASLAALAIVSWLCQFDAISCALFIITALISFWQLAAWKPLRVLTNPLLWILYLGYFGLCMGLLAAAFYAAGLSIRISIPVHVIAVAGFSPLILGMITRTALGHTGRSLHADKTIVAAYCLLLGAIVLRISALYLSAYNTALLHASAAFWAAAFIIYLVRFTPFLTQPRADKQPRTQLNIQQRS